MKFEFYNGTQNKWEEINGNTENVFFDQLDGFSGSSKLVHFRIVNGTGENKRQNLMLRVVEKYNQTEYPLLQFEDSEKVVAVGGNPSIDGKVKYAVFNNSFALNGTEGQKVDPDSQGLFRLGDLDKTIDAQKQGILEYAVKITVDKGILTSFGETLKISQIFFRYFSTNN